MPRVVTKKGNNVGSPTQKVSVGFLVAVIGESKSPPRLADPKDLVPDLGAVNGAEQRRAGGCVTGHSDNLQKAVRSRDVHGRNAEAERLDDRLRQQVKHRNQCMGNGRHNNLT